MIRTSLFVGKLNHSILATSIFTTTVGANGEQIERMITLDYEKNDFLKYIWNFLNSSCYVFVPISLRETRMIFENWRDN